MSLFLNFAAMCPISYKAGLLFCMLCLAKVTCSYDLLSFREADILNSLFLADNRGGVEDTRLEANAKDTKKIRGQGQGQPFRGQTHSRPRTGMLEAKAKD